MTPVPRTAVVTGGGRGIGRAIALRLADDGFDVAVVARSTDELRDVGGEVAARGRRAVVAPADVTDPAAASGAVARAEAELGSIGVLVHCAGAHPATAPVEDYPLELWSELLAVNLSAAFYTARAAVPAMKRQRSGRIVNVASLAAVRGFPNASAYVAAKHGLVGFTKVLARELGPYSVTANALCPGFVPTRMTEHKHELRAWSVANSASGRVVDVDEVASAAAYLASDAAGSITGQALPVCGGIAV